MSYLNQLSVVNNTDGTSVLVGESAIDREPITLTVKTIDLERYKKGALIQNCFPYLTRNERELIINV